MHQSSPPTPPPTMGPNLHPAGLRWVNPVGNGRYSVWERAARPASMGEDRVPDLGHLTMRRNPFLDFQRAAEARGYPGLLIVSMLCLVLVVASVALLALTPAACVL